MESTMPNANFQPQMVQYTPAESSMLKSVPPFVKPSSSNLAFVRTKRSADLNLKRRAPSAPTPAASLPHLAPCPAVAGVASKERLKAAIRAATTWYWVASVGNRSSAWRQAANAALGSPTMGYAAAGLAAGEYGPVTWSATPRLSWHASYSANPAISRWSGLVMPIMIGAAYASAMISARPKATMRGPGRGDVPRAASVEALTPAGAAADEAACARHSFFSSRAINEESVTTTAV